MSDIKYICVACQRFVEKTGPKGNGLQASHHANTGRVCGPVHRVSQPLIRAILGATKNA